MMAAKVSRLFRVLNLDPFQVDVPATVRWCIAAAAGWRWLLSTITAGVIEAGRFGLVGLFAELQSVCRLYGK